MNSRQLAEQLLPRLKDILGMFHELAYDLEDAAARVRDDSDAVNRRAYVRTLFALVEGFLSGIATYLLEGRQFGSWELSDEEQLTCADLCADPSEPPPAGPPKHRGLTASTKVLFKAGRRIFGEHCAVDCGTQEFQKFREAVRVRDRLTHPKRQDDLEVTDEELQLSAHAFVWFREASARFFESAKSRAEQLL